MSCVADIMASPELVWQTQEARKLAISALDEQISALEFLTNRKRNAAKPQDAWAEAREEVARAEAAVHAAVVEDSAKVDDIKTLLSDAAQTAEKAAHDCEKAGECGPPRTWL